MLSLKHLGQGLAIFSRDGPEQPGSSPTQAGWLWGHISSEGDLPTPMPGPGSWGLYWYQGCFSRSFTPQLGHKHSFQLDDALWLGSWDLLPMLLLSLFLVPVPQLQLVRSCARTRQLQPHCCCFSPLGPAGSCSALDQFPLAGNCALTAAG